MTSRQWLILCFCAMSCIAAAGPPVAPPPLPPPKTIPQDRDIESLCPRPDAGLYQGTCDARFSSSAVGSSVAFDKWIGCRMEYESMGTSTAILYSNDVRAGWERDADFYMARLKTLIPEKDWRLAERSHKANVARRPAQQEYIRRLYESKEGSEARVMASTAYADIVRMDALELGCMVEIASKQ